MENETLKTLLLVLICFSWIFYLILSNSNVESYLSHVFCFRYKLKSGTEYFDINKYDGSIIIGQSFEGSNFDSISLEVIAEDQGK